MLTRRFVWDGPLPALKAYPTLKDVEVCGESQVNESIQVNAEDKGLANVFVWLLSADAPTHPDLADDAAKEVHVHTRGCRFVPHCTAVRVGQSLVISNDDPIAHNPIPRQERPAFGRTIPVGPSVELIDRGERLPFSVDCAVHPWMRGWVLAQDHPYTAISDEHGRFEIPKLPVGRWEFQTWHEKAGYLEDVSINGQEVEWNCGRFIIDIDGETTDLETVILAATLFEGD